MIVIIDIKKKNPVLSTLTTPGIEPGSHWWEVIALPDLP